MRYGQDPNFRFTLARSIYKTILRYVNRMHGDDYVVTPLTPTHLKVELNSRKGEAKLTWQPTDDPQEPTAETMGYVVYTATGHSDFDNGTQVRRPSYTVKLEPGITYSFRVAATNKGGQSFPSEVVSVRYISGSQKTVLVVNGFHRLSSPAIVCNDSLQGFDLDLDPGITYGKTAGWTGRQTIFHRSRMGIEDETGLGYGTEELAGMFIAGNDFNYVRTHANAIATTDFNIVSCSVDAVEDKQVNLSDYPIVDLILGLEYDDGHSLVPYKTFSPQLQQLLRQYTQQGGGLMVSGAYVGSDMWHSATDRQFLADVLKCTYGGKDDSPTDFVNGLGSQFSFYRDLNEQHYAATRPDILQATPTPSAYATMVYNSGYGAAVAYSGNDYRTFTMGFPFECIKSTQQQAGIMSAILSFLIQK
jgi:hypothetical protein